MVTVTFIQPDGQSQTLDARRGSNLMQTALDHSIKGIVGECGGAMMCATCHCYIDDARLVPPVQTERDMLECADAPLRPTSRLGCQIKVDDSLSGLIIHIPEAED